LLLVFVPIQTHAGNTDQYLISFEEARQLQLTDDEWLEKPLVMRSVSNGPEISILKPQINNDDIGAVIETSSPTDLLVLFKEKSSPVAMDSINILAKKGMFKKNLTDRLKKYISGEKIDARELMLPSGKFLIIVEISDSSGRKTVEEYRLQVSKK